MKYINILEGFEREIARIDDAIEKPSTDDSLFWLNQAVGKFTKERFNGDFVHRTSYEQNEKRRLDLIKLFRTKKYDEFEYDNEQPSYDQYIIEYPKDFLFALNEDVIISDKSGGHKMDTCMFECTQDSFMYRITNSLTDFHYRYHRARPLRIREVNGCRLLTDKNYKIYEYTLGYLKKPSEITLENPFNEYEDFEDIIMAEIIKIAAQMYLENQKDERYRTITAEVNTQE